MKRDEFAQFDMPRKRGAKSVVVIAALALCLAGLLYMAAIRKESSTVFLNTDSVELAVENEKGRETIFSDLVLEDWESFGII